MKFKVNELIKEITFPLDKLNMNKEQKYDKEKILVKLVSKLQYTIKLNNEKINALRIDKNEKILKFGQNWHRHGLAQAIAPLGQKMASDKYN